MEIHQLVFHGYFYLKGGGNLNGEKITTKTAFISGQNRIIIYYKNLSYRLHLNRHLVSNLYENKISDLVHYSIEQEIGKQLEQVTARLVNIQSSGCILNCSPKILLNCLLPVIFEDFPIKEFGLQTEHDGPREMQLNRANKLTLLRKFVEENSGTFTQLYIDLDSDSTAVVKFQPGGGGRGVPNKHMNVTILGTDLGDTTYRLFNFLGDVITNAQERQKRMEKKK